MAEYIDRKGLRKALYDADEITFDGLDIIDNYPAADVQPVKHGKWIDYNPDNENDPRCICSVCGSVEFPLSRNKYCPNCGARMDGA